MSEMKTLPVLPLRDIVVFPHMIVPLFVGREKSVRALEEVMRGDKQILLATQKNAGDDDPATDAIHSVGVIASVLQLLKLPDGTVKVLVEGGRRVRLEKFIDNENHFEAEAEILEDSVGDEAETEALMRAAAEKFEDYVKLNKKVPPEAQAAIGQITEAGKLADSVSAHLAVKIADKQAL
ncbi:MAG TPA: endopeptidase La, partial [Alphaproteobacteria bacterium]|nr:endopeptidase La [Alphaproteobacteria bacterium]